MTPTNALPRWLGWCAVAGVLLLFIAASVQKMWGVDTWWQMAAGRWIVANGFPSTDVFSYTAANNQWIEVRWIFCILMHWGWQLGGPTMLIAGQFCMLLGTFALIAWPGRKHLTHPLVLALLAIALTAGLSRWVLRPELFTYLFSAAFLVMLDHVRRGGRGWWMLPLVQVIWTNSHTLFVMGPALTTIYFAGDLAQRLIDRARGRKSLCPISPGLLYAVPATIAACFINPWFSDGALFPITLFREISAGHLFAQTIGEFSSPFSVTFGRWTMDFYAALVLALASIGSCFLVPRHINIPRLLVVLAMCFLAEKPSRNTGLLAVICGWAAIANVADWLAVRRSERFGFPLLRSQFHAAGFALVALTSGAVAWYVATDRWAVKIGAPREFGIGVVWWNTPRNAVEFVSAVPAQGPFLNAMRDGGYMNWRLDGATNQQYKVYFDPRLEVYGDAAAEPLTLSVQNWDEAAARRGWNTALLPMRDHEDIIIMLAARPDWKLIYADFRNVIFVRYIPAHAQLISAAQPFAAWNAVDVNAERAPAWKRLYGGVGRPWQSTGLATTAMNLGQPALAKVWLAQGLVNDPDNVKLKSRLVPLLDLDGRTDDADRLLSELDPESRMLALRDSISRLSAAGRHQPALKRMEEYFRHEPDDTDMVLLYADTMLQVNQLPQARGIYESLLKQRPTVNELNKLAYVCERMNDIPSAIAACRASLALESRQPALLVQLGGLLEKQGDLPAAREAFTQALALKPDSAPARAALERLSPHR